jgi:hypothetical protein
MLRTLGEIKSDLEAARSRRDTIKLELEEIHRTADAEPFATGSRSAGRISKGLESAGAEVERLEDDVPLPSRAFV